MIAIVLVNWNGKSDTIECLESLMRMQGDPFTVYVVDNDSKDGSLQAIIDWAAGDDMPVPSNVPWSFLPKERAWRPRILLESDGGLQLGEREIAVHLIDAKANTGFAGGNNIGIVTAIKDSKVKYIWLLNNDTVVVPDCANNLIEAAELDGEAKLIGGVLRYYHNPNLIQGLGGYFNVYTASGGHIGGGFEDIDAAYSELANRKLSYTMGASMFFSTKSLDTLGFMSERYFLYFEELDWSEKLKGKGGQIVARDAVVFHKEGASIGTAAKTLGSSASSIYYMNRSMLIYYWTWHRVLIFIPYLRIMMRAVGFGLRGDASRVWALWAAAFDFLSGRRGVRIS